MFIESAQPADVGAYSVLVTNIFGAVRSADAVLGIIQPPVIIMHPAPFSVMPGAALTNGVAVTGDPPLRYQWRKNGVNLAGETNACLIIESVQVEHGGSYDVIVANSVSAVVSTQGVLRLVMPIVVPGDDFAQRTLLSPDGFLQAANVNAGKEPGEPNHGGKPGGSSVWYRWTAPFTGIATFRTVGGSTFDTLLAVYTGPNVSNLTAIASDER